MKLPRRDFLKTSLAASATAALASNVQAASATKGAAGRDYLDLRCYRLKPDSPRAALHAYLEKALVPALDRRGIKNVGVFTELDVNKKAATSVPKPDSPVWVLIPHATLDSFVSVNAEIHTDPAVLKAGSEYLQAKKASPAFDRIDSWLLLSFKSLPKLTVPAFSRSRAPGRLFEMRTYESHSEVKALSKMEMFDDGETEIMKSLGMSPVFFGQALAGRDLPHLTYMTSASDLNTHLANWGKFGPDPRWQKMKDLPKYVDNMSKNIPRFLAPTAYSPI